MYDRDMEIDIPEKWNDDVSFNLLNKLTISEIIHAIMHMSNRRDEDQRSNMSVDNIQEDIWQAIHLLQKHEKKLLREFPANNNIGNRSE